MNIYIYNEWENDLFTLFSYFIKEEQLKQIKWPSLYIYIKAHLYGVNPVNICCLFRFVTA